MKCLEVSNLRQVINLLSDRKFDRIISAKFKNELTELDILYLQEIFLLSGFHFIKFLSLDFAQSVIKDIVDSLSCYQNISILSVNIDFNGAYCNALYNKISSAYFNSSLEEFLLSNNWPEILIIELSEILISKPWFNDFMHLVADFNLSSIMPIILIS